MESRSEKSILSILAGLKMKCAIYFIPTLLIITITTSEKTISGHPVTFTFVLFHLLLAFSLRPIVHTLFFFRAFSTESTSQLASLGNKVLVTFSFFLSPLTSLGWPNIFTFLTISSISCSGRRGCCCSCWSRGWC